MADEAAKEQEEEDEDDDDEHDEVAEPMTPNQILMQAGGLLLAGVFVCVCVCVFYEFLKKYIYTHTHTVFLGEIHNGTLFRAYCLILLGAAVVGLFAMVGLFANLYVSVCVSVSVCVCIYCVCVRARACVFVCIHTQTHTGAVVVGLFADPMVDAVNGFSRASHIPAFFVAFIVTPFASNASEVCRLYVENTTCILCRPFVRYYDFK